MTAFTIYRKNRLYFGAALVCAMTLISTTNARATDSPVERLLVTAFKTNNPLDAPRTRLLENLLIQNVQGMDGFEVVSQNDVKMLLDVEQQKQLLGCTGPTCINDLGGALKSQWVIAGELTTLGTQTTLTVKLLHVGDNQSRNQLSKAVPDDEGALNDFMLELSYALFGREAPAHKRTPVAWYKKPWVWTVVGAVAIGGGTGGYFLARPPRAPKTTLGEVRF